MDNVKKYLADYVHIILGGTPKTSNETYWNGNIPWASVTDFKESKYLYDTEKSISQKGLNNSMTKLTEINDIIISARGTVGKIVQCKRSIAFNQSCYNLRSKGNKILDQNYLFYLLKFKVLELKQIAIGGVFDTITKRTFELMEVSIPPLPTQQKIAAILTAYDDLIENNNKRISILENMAEQIYKEWFVRMRFPGYKNTKFVKGIPDGWRVEKVEKAFDFLGGGTPSKSEERYWENGEINWFTPSDLTSSKSFFSFNSKDKCSALGLKNSSARLFPPYSIMMTSRATIGVVSINTTQASTNQGFITCIPNSKYPLEYLFFWLKLSKNNFELLANGATFLELIKSNFKKILVLRPDEQIIKKYIDLIKPIFSNIEILQKELQLLTKTRDLLLPRLLSGKLSVENLDIKFPPSMENDNA